MKIKIGDVCCVARVPTNMGRLAVKNEVGFVDEIVEDQACLIVLRLDGTVSGVGGFPLDCLEVTTSLDWLQAKAFYDERFEKERVENNLRKQAHDTLVATVASKYGVDPAVARAIHCELGSST